MEKVKDSKNFSKVAIIAISAIVFFIIQLIIFYAIGGFGNDSLFKTAKGAEIEVENITALSALNKEERLIYDILINHSSSFYNPSSLRVLEISETDGILPFVDLKLQAENRIGGIVTKYYTAYLDNYIGDMEVKKGELKIRLLQNTEIILKSETSDVGKINKAIGDYWREQGIN